MISIGQKASYKRNGKTISGKVTFVSNDGMIAAFLPEGERLEHFFHENTFNGKHYTATGKEVKLTEVK